MLYQVGSPIGVHRPLPRLSAGCLSPFLEIQVKHGTHCVVNCLKMLCEVDLLKVIESPCRGCEIHTRWACIYEKRQITKKWGLFMSQSLRVNCRFNRMQRLFGNIILSKKKLRLNHLEYAMRIPSQKWGNMSLKPALDLTTSLRVDLRFAAQPMPFPGSLNGPEPSKGVLHCPPLLVMQLGVLDVCEGRQSNVHCDSLMKAVDGCWQFTPSGTQIYRESAVTLLVNLIRPHTGG